MRHFFILIKGEGECRIGLCLTVTNDTRIFLLGMDEQYGKDGYGIYQMPAAEEISSECFTEFQNASTYMTQIEKHQSEIRKAIKSKTQKTLIVTEGATDWRHLKSALCSFQSQEENRYKNLDIKRCQGCLKGNKKLRKTC